MKLKRKWPKSFLVVYDLSHFCFSLMIFNMPKTPKLMTIILYFMKIKQHNIEVTTAKFWINMLITTWYIF